MTEQQKKTYIKAAIAVAVLVVLWLILRRSGEAATVIRPQAGDTLNTFQAPYFTTNPGIPDNWNINTGGSPFNSTNNINVNTGMINGLSNLYMPMFGLVGMTAVSG